MCGLQQIKPWEGTFYCFVKKVLSIQNLMLDFFTASNTESLT